MALKEKQSSSYFDSASEYPRSHYPYSDDENQADGRFDFITQSSASLTGSDTEYKCGSESGQEIVSAKRRKYSSKKTEARKADAADHHAIDAKAAKLKRKSSERNGGDSDVPKKKIKGRLWSPKDEIVLLEGLITYLKQVKGDYNGQQFYDVIKEKIDADVSLSQTKDKIHKLRKKYRDNEDKRGGPNVGKDPAFVKPHDQRLFELSKTAWGTNPAKDADKDSVELADKSVMSIGVSRSTSTDLVDFDDRVVLEAFYEYVKAQNIDSTWVGKEKRKSLKNKWRDLKVAEFRFRLAKAKLDKRVNLLLVSTLEKFDYI